MAVRKRRGNDRVKTGRKPRTGGHARTADTFATANGETADEYSAKEKPAARGSTKKRKTGRRAVRRIRLVRSIIIVAVAAVGIAAIVAWQLSSPTGIPESIQNFFALHGADGSGLDSVDGRDGIQLGGRYNRIELLSDTHYEVFNKKGGAVLSVQHGFSDPVMAAGEARTLIYDRGGSTCDIYNARRRVRRFTVDGTLYTAATARDGTVAVAYKSTDYLSVIKIYSKRGKLLGGRNFAKEYVTSLALSDNGRYLTATTLRAQGGVFMSTVYCIDAKSSEVISEKSYGDTVLNASEHLAGNFAIAAGSDKSYFVSAKDGTVKETGFDEKIAAYSVSRKGYVGFVCNGKTNVYENKIRIFDRKGEKVTDFDFKGSVDAFSISDSNVYILSDDDLHCYRIKDRHHTKASVPGATSIAAVKNKAVGYTGKKLVFPEFE